MIYLRILYVFLIFCFGGIVTLNVVSLLSIDISHKRGSAISVALSIAWVVFMCWAVINGLP